MSTTSDRRNVLLTYEYTIYTLKQSGSSYEWEKLPQQLSISRRFHLQLLVDESLINCDGKGTCLN